MNFVALIPARGGSKGIPDKNVRTLCGRPLIAWSIEHALETPAISRTIVSTDSERIAEVARQWGAEVPFLRPPELATDEATTESALLHAVSELSKTGPEPDAIVLLQPTSPIRGSGLVGRAVDLFNERGHDSLVSVTANHHFFWKKAGPRVFAQYDYLNRPRRQDIKDEDRLWRETGSIYITKTKLLKAHKNRIAGSVGLFETGETEAYEIDSVADFLAVEALLRQELRNGPHPDFSEIDLVVFDFDGVLTNNLVWVTERGEESVSCNRSDGLAISRLRALGLDILIMSTETNPVVEVRGRKLNVPALKSVSDKGRRIEAYMSEHGLDPKRVAYVGNDVNDVPAMEKVGWPMAVADAAPNAKSAARIVLNRKGGEGVAVEMLALLTRDGGHSLSEDQNAS